MFRSTGSYEPDHAHFGVKLLPDKFRSTGSYEPDRANPVITSGKQEFRSTGSYEPDLEDAAKQIPGQIVSIHRLLRA